jgi:hypothetical protein
MEVKFYKCHCCGYKTYRVEPPTDEIFNVCFWHDDYVQFQDLDYEGGANRVSLNQARQNFIKLGGCEEELLGRIRFKPFIPLKSQE